MASGVGLEDSGSNPDAGKDPSSTRKIHGSGSYVDVRKLFTMDVVCKKIKIT